MAKNKHYVVWKGLNPGIYDNWADCKTQVEGQAGAKYKAFETREEAVKAFEEGYEYYLRKAASPKAIDRLYAETPVGRPEPNSLAVDAACSGNPGDTNNVGEFLALVHGLALLKQKGSDLPIYSDSRNAILWVRKKKCKTLLERVPENEPIFNLIERAEKWLNENSYTTRIIKWETSEWGEIPADFGRK